MESKINTWDRPWTLTELRGEVDHWTLASDAGLIHFLEDMSSKIISRTREIETQVDQLVFESTATDIRVHNTFNEFLMLSNTQFIENRVYEDDETAISNKEPEKPQADPNTQDMTPQQIEQLLVPKYTEAITFGVELLNRIAKEEEEERIFLESQAAAEGTDVEPPKKKPRKGQFSYNPLPAVIGTKQFYEDDYCGLLLVDDIEEDEVIASDVQPPPVSNQNEEQGEEEEEEEEEEAEEEEEEEEEESLEQRNKTEAEQEDQAEETFAPANDFQAELAKKLKVKQGLVDEPHVDTKQKNLATDANESERDSRPASREKEKRESVVQSETNLFQDFENQEKDPFASANDFLGISTQTKRHTLSIPGLTDESSLFSDFDPSSNASKTTKFSGITFGEDQPAAVQKTEEESPAKAPAKKRPVGAVAMPGLFDKVDSEQTTDAPKSEPVAAQSKSKKTTSFALFSDESDSLFGEQPSTKSEVPSTQSKTKKASNLGLFDESDSLFGETQPPNNLAASKTETSATTQPKAKKSTSFDLFGESDSLFSESQAPSASVSKAEVSKANSSSVLFEDNVPAKKETPPTKKDTKSTSLFEEADAPMFANETALPKSVSQPKSSQKSSSSLFGEEQEEAFPVAKKSPAPEPKKAASNSLFESDDSDSLFSKLEPNRTKEKEPSVAKAEPKVELKPEPKRGLGLFDAADDDLFGSTKKTTAKKSDSLFDSGLDAPTVASSVSKAKSSSASLFGEDSADSLFPSSTTKKMEKKPDTIKKEPPSTSLLKAEQVDDDPFGLSSEKKAPTQPQSKIAASLALNFNPAMLMPGSAPPKKTSNDEVPRNSKSESSLDDQSSPQLVSLTKDRPMNTGRKPPSRKGRGKSDKQDKTKPDTNVQNKTNPKQDTSKPPSASSIFDDIGSSTTPISTNKSSTKQDTNKSQSAVATKQDTNKTQSVASSIFDDIGASGAPNKPAPKQDTSKPQSQSAVATKQDTNKTQSVASSIFDDIGVSSTPNKGSKQDASKAQSATKQSASKQQTASIFDDIATNTANKPSAAPSKQDATKSAASIFDDVGTPAKSQSSKQDTNKTQNTAISDESKSKQTPTITKTKDLGGSIFDDLVPATPSSAKPKEEPQSKTASDVSSIFDDTSAKKKQEDKPKAPAPDIFSDPSSSTKSKKKPPPASIF